MSEQTLFPTPDQTDATEAVPAPVLTADQSALPLSKTCRRRRPSESRCATSRTASGCAASTRCASGSCGASATASPGCGSRSATPAAAPRRSAGRTPRLSTRSARPAAPIHVTGTFEMSERWGAKIKIAALREAEPHEFESDELAPESDVAVDELEADLRSLLATIQDPQLRLLLDSFFAPGSEAWARFRDAPAAKTYHQAYRHGLLEHTLSVAQAVSAASNFFPGIDREVAVTGALLHDIGKTEAYNDDPLAIDLTDLGRLQGEIPLGYYLVRRQIEELPGFDPALAQAVLHIILSHHGQLEHGSPVVPATREAVLVHMIDNLGGRLGSFDRLERQLPAGESWSGFDRALSGSRLLRPARRLASAPSRQQRRDPLEHGLRFAVEADVGDADQLDPGERQVLVAEVIALEGGLRAVGRVGIEFDREPLLGPVDVELEPGLEEVGRRPRQAGCSTASKKRGSKPERVKGTGA